MCAGREIAGPSPERAVVFQNHSLLPWLTCYENIHLASSASSAAPNEGAQLRERTMRRAGAGGPDGAAGQAPA
jgi:nitrate/nitrite transport system ATP-binding protein